MAKILIAGALDLSDQKAHDFVQLLGQAVVANKHILLNGCCNEFDTLIAKSAFDFLQDKGANPYERIISYTKAGSVPAHTYGTILKSRLDTWGLEFKRLLIPEPIDKADVVVIVGGKEGTMCAANWARIANKPLLPITAFGGTAETTFNEELKVFQDKYSDRIEQIQYETLNQALLDLKKIADDAISLAARIAVSSAVLVIMSYSGDPRLEDSYESFREVCEEFQYQCKRIDEIGTLDRIVPEIMANIKKAAFIIADLSVEKPNVYYELGFAQGLKKPLFITAFKGTILPFDVNDIPTIFWEGQKQLKAKLREKINEIAKLHGRVVDHR